MKRHAVAGCTFDMEANAAYLRVADGKIAETREGRMDSMEVLVDIAKDGKVLGVEILNLKRALELLYEKEKLRLLVP